MHRFFEPGINENERGSFPLNSDNSHHINTALRLTAGEEITVCDGRGTDFLCRIEKADKKCVYIRIYDSMSSPAEPGITTVLFQCMPKADKMDLIIQKCVELGVSEIVPVISDFSISRPDSGSKIERFNKISESAAQQSGRSVIPKVHPFCTFAKAIELCRSYDNRIAAYEGEKELMLKSYLKAFKGKSAAVFIGAEGGFSEKEAQIFRDENIACVSLGGRILRTETAGLYVMSCINYELF